MTLVKLFSRGVPIFIIFAGVTGLVIGKETGLDQLTVEPKVTVITEDTVLVPGTDYGRLEIAASNIVIDGRGIVLNGINGNNGPASNQRTGVAISSVGQHNVVLKNVSAHGWETGLKLVDAVDWSVEGCDFSDNFHDPEFGWGENGRRGGIILERVTQSTVRECRANRVWDGCVLIDSDNNKIIDNDFSRTSNTCLKLWHSSANQVEDNNLSYGIRIREGEVHARDSTGVLVENGSNRNIFLRNDCTHGGDGIFIRVLNGWVSTENWFAENDCSYANNNGFECWAPRNTFVSNKANHCSYGFWLGGSDQTRLIGNEACFNGKAGGFHNSPHLPDNGHAGIVFMFGPSSHILAYGNRCTDNEGAGIALIGHLDSKGEKWKAYHWVIAENHLLRNRWGVFAQHADWITMQGNLYQGNTIADLYCAENVSRLSTNSPPETAQREASDSKLNFDWYASPGKAIRVLGPASAIVGQEARFELDTGDGLFSRFEWDLGDRVSQARMHESNASNDTMRISHKFERPGFYRVGVTASGDTGIDLAYRDFYVTSASEELAEDVKQWAFQPETGLKCTFVADSTHRIRGHNSLRVAVAPYHGGVVRLSYPARKGLDMKLAGKTHLAFWIKANNPNLPGWQSNNPEVTLYASSGERQRIVPVRDMMQEQTYNEAREGWRYIAVPLAGDNDWTHDGKPLESLDYFTIGFDSWGGDPLEIWIDGVVFE